MLYRYEVRTAGIIIGLCCGWDEDALSPAEFAILQGLGTMLPRPPADLVSGDLAAGTTLSFFTEKGHHILKGYINLYRKFNPAYRNLDAEEIVTVLPEDCMDDRFQVIYADEFQVLIGDPLATC